MKIALNDYEIEKIICNIDLDKHPVKNQNYTTRLVYLSFLYASLRLGKRNKFQINGILSIYKLKFGINDNDFIELKNIEFKDGNELLQNVLRTLNFSNQTRRSKFIESYCSKLLLGEMLFFDLNDSYEFFPNIFVRMYTEFFNIPITYEDEIKSLLLKIVSNEDVRSLLKQKKMQPFKYFHDCMKQYWRKQQKDTTNVTVIATMSSGKSTLLNALIGKKVFPSENKACTSKYLKFTNNPKQPRDIGIASGQYLDSRWNISYDDISQWNFDSTVDRIELEGPMNSFSMLKKFNVTFIDTPGTNNSRDRQHGAITQEILEQRNSDIILYVLNATNLASDDDSNLLRQVIKELGNQRIIFLLNKTDQLDLEADDSITDSLNIAREYVMEHGIISPTIIPISSYAAGLFKYILDGKPLTNREKRDALALLELFQISQYDMNRYIDKTLIKSLPQSAINVRSHKNLQLNNELINSKTIYEAMKKTGIYILEKLLLQGSSIPYNGR